MSVKTYGKKRMLSFYQKVLFTLLILFLYRVLSHIPLPFVSRDYMKVLVDGNGSLGFLNVLTGGSLEKMSFMALGITPYITASIIIQLLGVVFSWLADMQKEGSTGQRKIEMITVCLAAVLALLESVFMMMNYGRSGLLSNYTWYTVLIPAVIMTLGVFLVSFFGQFITKHLFGNGISLILVTGILASYLTDASVLYEMIVFHSKWAIVCLRIVLIAVGLIALFAFTIWLNQCEKRIRVTYSGRVGSGKQYSMIPLKLIGGSVVPVIFASSVITLPGLIQSFTKSDAAWFKVFNMSYWFSASVPWASIGVILYGLLIVWFNYYYNDLNLNEKEIAYKLRKHGGVIDGIRPGKPTEDYLKSQMKYLTLLGGLGLCVIAFVPNIVNAWFHISNLSFLGTSIIIVVSVIAETKANYKAERLGSPYAKTATIFGQPRAGALLSLYGGKKA